MECWFKLCSSNRDQIDRSRDTDNHTSLDDEGSTFEIVYYLYN